MTPLETTLADLNTALRAGDFARIAAISAMLETVHVPQDSHALRRASRLATENLGLLAASARGVQAARRRLAELRSAQRLATYDGQGRRIETASAKPGTKRI